MAVDVLWWRADKKLRQFMSIIGSFTCGIGFHYGARENRGKSTKIPPWEQAVICWGKTNNGIFSCCYPIWPVFYPRESFKFVTGGDWEIRECQGKASFFSFLVHTGYILNWSWVIEIKLWVGIRFPNSFFGGLYCVTFGVNLLLPFSFFGWQ